MKVRIISDLHLDINTAKIEYDDKDTFTIVCGDTSGYNSMTIKWLKNNVHNGVFVAGNHIVYNDRKKPLSELKDELAKAFPLTDNLSFLENSRKTIEDKVFVGCTLYTDYNNDPVAESNALFYMNDFRWGWYDKGVKLLPKHYKEFHEKSVKYIEETCNLYPDKDIIVVTHHAPFPIGEQNAMSSSYCSNLRYLFEEHPNIKLWCFGHLHGTASGTIGNARYVMNCRGYRNDVNFDQHLTIEI